MRSMSIARVRRTFKSLEQPEARTWRSPNFSACTRNHSRPERNLDRSRSPVQVESPGTGMARMSACTHRGLHRTLLIWNNALTFLYYALFNRKSIKPMTRREKGVKIILGSLLLIYDTSCFDNINGNTGPKRFKSRLCPGQSCPAHCARFELMYLPVGLDEFQLETRRIYSQITIERATKVMIEPSFLICKYE